MCDQDLVPLHEDALRDVVAELKRAVAAREFYVVGDWHHETGKEPSTTSVTQASKR